MNISYITENVRHKNDNINIGIYCKYCGRLRYKENGLSIGTMIEYNY